jgi:Uma2 family endonuclease
MNAPFRPVTKPEKVRLRVDDFLLLNDNGAFADYSKTELLEGEIFFMNAQHSRHARIKTELAIELAIVLREMATDLRPIVEASTRVSEYSLPEPDIVVTSYKGPHVVPLESVALLVEVADTTLKIDLGRKLRIYAAARIAEYWVVDAESRVVHQMWSPSGKSYREKRTVALGERIEAVTVAGLAVETRGI